MNLQCDCCNSDKFNLRPINSGHTLCSPCNLKLIKNSTLRLDSERVLEVYAVRGDFLLIKETQSKEMDFWARRSEAMLQAQMDNQSMVGYEFHESY
jgi:hypothetical protein